MAEAASSSKAAVPAKESVKETIISVIIAFAMAFVFRSFVAEAFIIPTGSMAPTLMGAHMRFTSPYTGEDWAVSPWFLIEGNSQNPWPNQVEFMRQNNRERQSIGQVPFFDDNVVVHDPVTGLEVPDPVGKMRAGDRIFVLKYLYGIQSPDPFDVVVFKNPTMPDENYIKRLIALPGEQVALVDGDVFVRPVPKTPAPPASGTNVWDASDWTIRRKPADAQRAVWQRVFDSSLMTGEAVTAGAVSPWAATGATVDRAQSVYTTTGGAATVAWDSSKKFIALKGPWSNPKVDRDRMRDINDRYAYNEAPPYFTFGSGVKGHFPVSDLRLRATVVPKGAAPMVSGVIEARGHEFRATIANGKAEVSMKPLEGGESKVLGTASYTLGSGPARIEFWHSDQRLQLWVNGKLIVSGEYNWLPMERLKWAMTSEAWSQFTGPTKSQNILADPASYKPSTVRWETSGAPVELRGVALDRDLYYRPDTHPAGVNQRDLARTPAAATSPQSTMTLGPDQFFVCGDNSPQSLDARLWGYPDAWVAEEIDPSPSVVAPAADGEGVLRLLPRAGGWEPGERAGLWAAAGDSIRASCARTFCVRPSCQSPTRQRGRPMRLCESAVWSKQDAAVAKPPAASLADASGSDSSRLITKRQLSRISRVKRHLSQKVHKHEGCG
ncbi:MAG: signal peptidase I [Phycisphaerales bacterium]